MAKTKKNTPKSTGTKTNKVRVNKNSPIPSNPDSGKGAGDEGLASIVEVNTLEKKKSKGGQPRVFETAQRFRQAWQKYFDWADRNPWIKKDFVKSGPDAGMLVDIPTERPYTLQSFHAYYDLSGDYCDALINSLKTSGSPDYQEYLAVYQWAKNKCTSQKVEGALVGAFNANLVARIESIKEQTDITTGGDKLQQPQIDLTKLTYEQLKALSRDSEADKD